MEKVTKFNMPHTDMGVMPGFSGRETGFLWEFGRVFVFFGGREKCFWRPL